MDWGPWTRRWAFRYRGSALLDINHSRICACIFRGQPILHLLRLDFKTPLQLRPPEVALLNMLVFENLRQRPVRTCLSVLAIGVEDTMILTLVGISYGTLDETARRACGVGADIIVRPPASSIISTTSVNTVHGQDSKDFEMFSEKKS